MRRLKVIIAVLGVLLLASTAVGYYLHQADRERISELESQLRVLREQEHQSTIDRQVSRQMEKIAYGQQNLSEERSREAIRQSEIAQKMTLLSEAERHKAIEAQGIAERSAAEAMAAYQMADRQRREADEQRRQAEHAKLVTDTLNYITLGRTLGSQSYSLYKTGDIELGNMLAYAAYLYTKDYGGDLFSPSVFEAITQAAGSRRSYHGHYGSIASVDILPNSRKLLTVSTYGEIFTHSVQGGKMITDRLMSDKQYSFRDIFVTESDKSYAVSSSGHLVIINDKRTRVMDIDNVDKPFTLQGMKNGKQLLIIGENSMAFLDTETDKILATRRLPFRVMCSGRYNSAPVLFDNRGGRHSVTGFDNVSNEKTGVEGQVSAFASSNGERLSAYGMYDGSIWLVDGSGTKQKLVGHLSQITRLKFDGKRLYSSSYDGQLLFWLIGEQQKKPIMLFHSGSWLTDFVLSKHRDYIWTGENDGSVTQYLISLPMIAQRLRQNVKRNFTREEWNLFVGKGIPYRKLRD